MQHDSLKKVRLFLLLAGIASLLLAASTFLTADLPTPSFAETKANYQPSDRGCSTAMAKSSPSDASTHKVRRLEWVRPNTISPATQDVLLLSEDKRFYRHGGVDWLALLASGASNLWHLRMASGRAAPRR